LIRVGAKLCRDRGPPGPRLVNPDLNHAMVKKKWQNVFHQIGFDFGQ